MKQKTAVICLSRVNGGMELASVKLARILSTEVEIEFIARDKSYILEKKEHFEGYKIKVHKVCFSGNLSLSLIKSVRDILIKNSIKNVIFLGASEMKSLYFATLGLNINFIIRQGSKKTTSKKDFFHKLFYSNVNYFVGNCEYMKQNIIDILPIPKKAKVTRIYSSLKLDKEVSFKEYDGKIDLVHVGRVHPGKGQLEAIKACAILYKNSINFNIKFLGDIQDENYYKNIQKYLETIKYKEKIEFVGYTNEVKRYLQKSDIFIFPSLGEGMSNAIIESLGFGLIPIIYNDTSSPEFKDLGFHIHLTKENSLKELEKIVLNVAQNIKEEKEKAKENHKKALEIFAPSREQKEYLELLV
ncbi:glycosyltransferase [Halarcobacter anaerophilus]|uniref:glycosyltransferase n=1 Tax=Halarcobacter anaerophilus TaxID=877500 RepID=UPI00069871EF|nr:glycosyltransferase [Halarcobacter anaerophilus]